MKIEQRIKNLFNSWSNKQIDRIEPIAESGSNRKYFRVFADKTTAIAAYNPDIRENIAFLSFSKHFKRAGLPVAKVLLENSEKDIYLLEDLGEISLYDIISNREFDNDFKDEWIELYKKVLDNLLKFQIDGAKGLDFSLCYPRDSFDEQSISWDLNYFKYYFLKLKGIPFDEQLLENDFNKLTNILLTTDTDYFMYRDFQSRNVMIKNGEPFFIDFQGGRKGALQYDLASLLYQSKAKIPDSAREELLMYYIDNLKKYKDIDITDFIETYNAYVLIRILQVLGAYGYRGYFERKAYFIQSIPPAIRNLDYLIPKLSFIDELPELKKCIQQICHQSKPIQQPKSDKLTVKITSFSYKKSLPTDDSGNGGGFVFDCRSLPNPGRFIEYKELTGKDIKVIDFFADKEELPEFLNKVFSLVDASVGVYMSRGFSNLMVSFGCTGGQHRSVYSAEKLLQHLRVKFDINIEIIHREQGDI